MDELHDWSAYLIQAEKELRIINDKLLHKQYAGLEPHIQKIKDCLEKTLMWAQENREQ